MLEGSSKQRNKEETNVAEPLDSGYIEVVKKRPRYKESKLVLNVLSNKIEYEIIYNKKKKK